MLRCEDTQRLKAPNPSTSEMHPLAFQLPFDTSSGNLSSLSSQSINIRGPTGGSLSDFGGLFDGATLVNEPRSPVMPFGGDGSWEDEHDHGQHLGNDWSRGSHSGQQRQNTGRQRSSGSRAPSGSLMSSSSTSPAIVINVNQPSGPVPQPWRPFGGSPVDSWAPPGSPILPALQAGQSGQEVGRNSDSGWQTWMQGPRQGRTGQQPSSSSSSGSKDNDQNQGGNDQRLSSSRTGSNQARNVPGAWDTTQQLQHGNNGWENQGGDSSNMYNSQNPTQNYNNGWDHNASYESQNHDNSGGWNDNRNHGDQQNREWDNNGNENGGGWNADQNNDQGDAGWGNGDGNNGGWNGDQNDNAQQGDWNENNQNESGNGWGNADAGANEPKASTGQDWNMSANNQGGWNQVGEVNHAKPVSAGGSDRTKPRNRRTSLGKAKSVKSNVSRQASISSAAHQTGWRPHGAWPDDSQNPAGFGAFQSGSTGFAKPYHVFPDAAGNPKLPDMHPAPSVPAAPAPPFEPAKGSSHVQRGKPALYHHKVASPKYMDTHDKPYAVFVFRYRTKGRSPSPVLPLGFPLTTNQLPSNKCSVSRYQSPKRCKKQSWRISQRKS